MEIGNWKMEILLRDEVERRGGAPGGRSTTGRSTKGRSTKGEDAKGAKHQGGGEAPQTSESSLMKGGTTECRGRLR
jgi:hypothetical protein